MAGLSNSSVVFCVIKYNKKQKQGLPTYTLLHLGNEYSQRASLQFHCEKKSLAYLLLKHGRTAEGQPTKHLPRINVNARMCMDCHDLFAAASKTFRVKVECNDNHTLHVFDSGEDLRYANDVFPPLFSSSNGLAGGLLLLRKSIQFAVALLCSQKNKRIVLDGKMFYTHIMNHLPCLTAVCPDGESPMPLTCLGLDSTGKDCRWLGFLSCTLLSIE